MNSKIMCLTWNNHDKMVKQNFEMFLKSSVLSDCTISAEGQHLKAHKIMLAACSHYFETLFRDHNMNNPVIVLKDVKFYNVKALLHFMYNGEVMVSQDHLADFIETAKSLQVRGLEDEYQKYDLRKILKKPKLDVISTTCDPITPIVQMKTNYSDFIDIDETGLTIGISRLSVNSDNYSPYRIQNTTIAIHSLPSLTSFELNNAKLNQRDAPEIKSEIQNLSQIHKTVKKEMVQPTNSDQLEKTTTLNNNVEVKEISKDLKIQPTILSSEPETSVKKHHHKSVQTQKAWKTNKSHKEFTTERKLTDLTTSVINNSNNNESALSLPLSQTQHSCKHPCCISASLKTQKLEIHEKKNKSRNENHYCEICKGTFSSTSRLINHHCSAHKSWQYHFTVEDCEMFKRPVKKSHLNVRRGTQPFMCRFCHKEFRNIMQLQAHIHEHRRLKRGNPLPFICRYCQRSFMHIKHLQYHLNEHKRNRFLFQEWAKRHRQNNLSVHSHDPVFECPVSRKAFTKKVYLHEHQYFHDRK